MTLHNFLMKALWEPATSFTGAIDTLQEYKERHQLWQQPQNVSKKNNARWSLMTTPLLQHKNSDHSCFSLQKPLLECLYKTICLPNDDPLLLLALSPLTHVFLQGTKKTLDLSSMFMALMTLSICQRVMKKSRLCCLDDMTLHSRRWCTNTFMRRQNDYEKNFINNQWQRCSYLMKWWTKGYTNNLENWDENHNSLSLNRRKSKFRTQKKLIPFLHIDELLLQISLSSPPPHDDQHH